MPLTSTVNSVEMFNYLEISVPLVPMSEMEHYSMNHVLGHKSSSEKCSRGTLSHLKMNVRSVGMHLSNITT